MNITLQDLELYKVIEPHLSTLFDRWIVKSWTAESADGRQQIIISTNFCRLELLKDRSPGPSGYHTELFFAPKWAWGNMQESLYDVLFTLNIAVHSRTCESCIEWAVDNPSLFRRLCNPWVFLRMQMAQLRAIPVFNVISYKYLARSCYILLDSDIIDNRLAEVSNFASDDEVTALYPDPFVARHVFAALHDPSLTATVERQGTDMFSSESFSLKLMACDQGQHVYIWPRESEFSKECATSVVLLGRLLFIEHIEPDFVAQLRFIIRYRESIALMMSRNNYSEVRGSMATLSTMDRKHARIAFGKE